MEEQEILERLNKGFQQIFNTVPNQPYCCFMSKSPFFAAQEKNYFVIGTRLIVNPCYLNKTSKADFETLFYETDLTHAEFFKTRNAAKRAVARNRRGIEKELPTNEKEVMIRGIKTILVESNRFCTETEGEE